MAEDDNHRHSKPISLLWVIGGILAGIGVAVWLGIEDGFSIRSVKAFIAFPLIGFIAGVMAAKVDGRF